MKNEEMLSDLFLIIINKNELVKYDNGKNIYLMLLLKKISKKMKVLDWTSTQ